MEPARRLHLAAPAAPGRHETASGRRSICAG